MEFRLFGQVELVAAGQRLDVGTPRQQTVLAALIVDAGRCVTTQTLIGRVWDDAAPVEARNVLYSHVSRVRRLLARAAAITDGPAARVERAHAGYLMILDPELVDLHRFQRLAERGRDANRSDMDRGAALGEALELWRADPLAALTGQWPDQIRRRWYQQRLDVAEQWAHVELRLGHPSTVIPVLHDLLAEYPLAEPLEGLLMRALHAAGRSAQALDRYTIVRQRLADQLGADPSPPLQQLHKQILRADPGLNPPTTARLAAGTNAGADSTLPQPVPQQVPRPAAQEIPRQLPAPPRAFTGRAHELATLDALLNQDVDQPTSVVLAVSGTAGIGKTALAVLWAHRIANRFPDGQLFLNLRGFDPARQVIDPAHAIRRLLDALQVAPQRSPADLDDLSALYRTEMAGRRMLILLDNARDTAQVRPLLPGTPGCLVLVTSRNQLSGLVAADGAYPLALDLLTPDEARHLLTGRIGILRVAREPTAVTLILARCAHLPLALTLAAARAALRPQVPLHVLAGELRDTPQRWHTLTGDDPADDLRTVFSWSYRALTPPAARLFRLLGLHPGPDITAPAAASLAGVCVPATRQLLDELAHAHLITEHRPARYTFHDLLRAYAAEQTQTTDDDQQRHAAIGRMLDHYLHTADTADHLLHPAHDRRTLTPPQPEVTPETPHDHQAALDWFTAERPVLLAAVEHATATGFDAHACQLTFTLLTFLNRRGHWHEHAAVARMAVAAARRLADPPVQASAHRHLAHAYTLIGRFDDAEGHLRHALDLDHPDGHAFTHYSLAWLAGQRGHPAQALDHARTALHLSAASGHQRGQAHCRSQVGWYHALLGDYQRSLTYCGQALTQHQHLGDRTGQADAWNHLGYAHHHLGQHAQALTCYHHALALRRDIGDRYNEAATHAHLADVHRTIGDDNAARAAWQHALDILTDLNHRDGDQLRAAIATLEAPQPTPAPPTLTSALENHPTARESLLPEDFW